MATRYTLEAVFKAIDRFSKPMAKMGTSVGRVLRNMNKGVAETNALVNKGAAGIAKFGVAATAATAIAATGLVAAASTGADFEEAITAVGAVSLMTRDQIADLEKKALELGATTKFSATQVANGMELMGRAGFTNAEILEGIGGVLAAAAAEGGEFAETAGTISNTLKGMGLAASETTRVADVLTLASARTNSSISSLGESMKNLGPVARQLNIPLEQAVAAVAMLQDVGIDASEAGTATATMLTKLASPTDDVAAKMRQLGIAFKDAKGNALSFPAIMAQFDKAAKKSGGNMDVLAFFADLVGLRGQKAALNLKELFASGKLSTLTDELKNAKGSAEKMAGLRMQNLKGDIEQLGGAVDSVKIALFNTQSGPLRGMVQGMTDWIGKNQEFITSGFQEAIKRVGDAMPTILDTLERIGRAAGPILAVAAAVKVWSIVQWLLNAAMTANPITLWIIGLTAVAALIAAFWPELKAGAIAAWEYVANAARAAWDAVVGVVLSAWDKISAFMKGYIEFFIGFWSIILSPVLPIYKALFSLIAEGVSYVIDNWGTIVGFFSDIWTTVAGVFSTAWGGIVAAATAVYEAFKAVWAPISEFFSALWQGVVDTFNAVFGGILTTIGGTIDTIRSIGRQEMGTEPADGEGAQPSIPEGSMSRERMESVERIDLQVHGPATVKRKKPKGGSNLTLSPSGAF